MCVCLSECVYMCVCLSECVHTSSPHYHAGSVSLIIYTALQCVCVRERESVCVCVCVCVCIIACVCMCLQYIVWVLFVLVSVCVFVCVHEWVGNEWLNAACTVG